MYCGLRKIAKPKNNQNRSRRSLHAYLLNMCKNSDR